MTNHLPALVAAAALLTVFVTIATFADPGTYVLRGLADDGALLGSDDVTVVVTP